jgi:Cytochrome c554 and c-prime
MLGNTTSSNKTNFWQFAPQLFGVSLPNDIGLTGNGLSGRMSSVEATKEWIATGIPVTPRMDNGSLNAYPFASVIVRNTSNRFETRAVVPVSWEISCNLCHTAEGGNSIAHDILADHDRLHGTNLVNQKPVLCAGCHADPALGTPGTPGVSSMSSAMHTAHADRMGMVSLQNECYACHPGIETDCQRDNHKSLGINCVTCHGGMAAVGSPTRASWTDEPRCSNCHNEPGHDYEEPGKLYKQSRGHGGVLCAACHGSPHVIAPSTNAADNQQAIKLQGYAGTLNKCTVCHIRPPEDPFFHTIEH